MNKTLYEKFWSNQNQMKLLNSKKYKYKTKALLMTLLPTYIVYFNFYENKIRKHSFILQFIIIYNLYKFILTTQLSYDSLKIKEISPENN